MQSPEKKLVLQQKKNAANTEKRNKYPKDYRKK
jgi:hypothetical protein